MNHPFHRRIARRIRNTARPESSVLRGRQRFLVWTVVAQLLLMPLGAPVALANPADPEVLHGGASFDGEGTNHLTIHQLPTNAPGNELVIDWGGGFNLGANDTVIHDQPDAGSRILHIDITGSQSLIDGTLTANGIVYIANPMGVFFQGNAVVNVAGLVAAGGSIDMDDFIDGNDVFTGLTGSVEVLDQVEINATELVQLIGHSVVNHGVINTPDGVITLVAGEEVTLTRMGGRVDVVFGVPGSPDPATVGVNQTGTLNAGDGEVFLTTGDFYSLAINHEGITTGNHIRLEAGEDGSVEVAGSLDASDTTTFGGGGEIEILGDSILVDAATVDASGGLLGGTVLLGGQSGGGGDTPRSRRVYVGENAILRADAQSSGNGGSIVIRATEAAGFDGTASATGGATGGDGGRIEIVADAVEIRGTRDVSAVAGEAGSLAAGSHDVLIHGGDQVPAQAPSDGAENRILTADLGTLDTVLDVSEAEIENAEASLEFEAAHSITTTGVFDHQVDGEGVDVLLLQNKSLTLRTRNADAPIPPVAIAAGIDLTQVGALPEFLVRVEGGDLAFVTGEGGAVPADEDTGDPGVIPGSGGPADIRLGRIETDGGDLFESTADGSITQLSIDTSSSEAEANAGNLRAEIATGAQPSEIVSGGFTVEKDLILSGSSATDAEADGGSGGIAEIFIGVQLGIDGFPGSEDVTGGVSIGADRTEGGPAIDASGGSAEHGSGGRGGRVTIATGEGDARVFGPVAMTGGNSVDDSAGGGAGGVFQITTARASTDDDADPLTPPVFLASGQVDIDSSVSAWGGNGSAGGRGGDVFIETQGTGTVNVKGLVDASGGAGATESGGDASGALFSSRTGDVTIRDDVRVLGGSGATAGGRGGRATLETDDGAIIAGGIQTSGGIASDSGARETAGTIIIDTDADGDAVAGIPANSVTLEGQLVALGTGSQETGSVSINASGSVIRGSTLVGEEIVTDLDVAVQGQTIGNASNAFQIDAGGAEGNIDSVLAVRAEDLINVDVTRAGFDAIDVSIASDGFSADIVQHHDALPADEIHANGTRTTLNIDGVDVVASEAVLVSDTTSSDATYRFDLSKTDATLIVANGSEARGGTTRIRSSGDLLLGSAAGTAFTAHDDLILGFRAGLGSVEGGDIRSNPAIVAGGGTIDIVSSGDVTMNANNIAVDSTRVITAGDQLYAGAVEIDQGRNASFEASAGSVIFESTLDGPGRAAVTAGTRATFQANVGQSERLEALVVTAPEIEFNGSAVVAADGGITLNRDGRPDVPERATIFGTGESLSFQTTGDLITGRREKIAATGNLEFHVDRLVTGDLAAVEISVDATEYTVLGREGGRVLLPDGQSTIADVGTDITANQVRMNVIPEWDGFGERASVLTPRGDFVGPGPGNLNVGLLTPDGEAIGPENLTAGDLILDLTAYAALVNPASEIPREQAPVADWSPPRFSDETPPAVPPIPARDMLAFLRCTADCPEPAAFGGTLAAEAARAYGEFFGDASDTRRQAMRGAVRDFGEHKRGHLDASALRAELARSQDSEATAYLESLRELLARVRLLPVDDAGAQALEDRIVADAATQLDLDEFDAGQLAAATDRASRGLQL